MQNDNDKNERTGSPDRKTRVKGDRVIHTTAGGIYKGDRIENVRGLTTEQSEEQRVGTKIGERQVREAAQGAAQSTPNEALGGQRRPNIEHTRGGSDEVAEEPFGRKGEKQSREGS